jgi:GMP synthase-like glutamine amidotransferase
MKIHCIRHEPFEGPGYIEWWAKENNHTIQFTRTYMHQSFPDEIDFELLIIMGGSVTLHTNVIIPWLAEEEHFILKAISQNKKILGICLGAQILAKIHGAKIYPGKSKEIGWYPVRFHIPEPSDFSFLPKEMPVFHWHGDTFDLPEGSQHLASSALTPNQAFTIGKNIVAFQFHLEMTAPAVKKIIKALQVELCNGGEYVQSAADILNQTTYVNPCKEILYKFLDRFITLS